MAWDDTNYTDATAPWCLESYEPGMARLLFPAGDRAAMAEWKIMDKIEVVRGLTKRAAIYLADDIKSQTQTQQKTVHATANATGGGGAFEVRKTTHEVEYMGTQYSDSSASSESSASSGGS